MVNKKQFRILIIALIIVFAVGMVYFAIKNKTQGGSGDDTLAFTTLADNTSALPAPGPDPSNQSETEPDGTELTADETEGPSDETPGDQSEETPSETDTPAESAGNDSSEGQEETPAPTESTSVETAPPETTTEAAASGDSVTENGVTVTRDGEYTDKEHVALYLHAFGELPQNYITKEEAEDLGWVSSLGNLWKVAPGKSIGGSHFGNYEKLLPTKKGRKYYECDIDYKGKGRGAKRIIYSNDGLVFYTSDHYESFEQLY